MKRGKIKVKEIKTVKNEGVIKEIASKVWWAIRGVLKLALAVAMVPVLIAIMGSIDAKNRRN